MKLTITNIEIYIRAGSNAQPYMQTLKNAKAAVEHFLGHEIQIVEEDGYDMKLRSSEKFESTADESQALIRGIKKVIDESGDMAEKKVELNADAHKSF